MSASQHHGFDFEKLLLAEFPRRNPQVILPPVPLNHEYTARFDVSGYLDPYGTGIPTSIKTAKYRGPRTLICLSDAYRIVQLGQQSAMRLMVGLYRQEGAEKVFGEVREYVITGEEWQALCGHVPAEEIEDFAYSLTGKSSESARLEARKWKTYLAGKYPGLMRWNPKIDSKNQRRLQCSVPLQDLESVIKDKSRIKVFGQAMDERARPGHLLPVAERLWGRGLRFPLSLLSEARVRSPKPATRRKATDRSPARRVNTRATASSSSARSSKAVISLSRKGRGRVR